MQNLPVHSDISCAHTLPKAFYLSSSYWEMAKEKIFSRTWQWLDTQQQAGMASNCFPAYLLPELLNEPLLVTTDKAGNSHCLSNVCTHRGAILVKEACSAAHIRCPYHGRMFDLNGSFKSMPGFRDVQNFPTDADNLQALPLMSFAGSQFTRLSGNHSFGEFFAPMQKRLNWFPFEALTYRPDLSKDYHLNAHWALYCENYLEGFHIPFVHPALNQALDFANYRTELFKYSSLQVGIAKEEENCFDLPASSPDYGEHIAAYYWFVFPNLMFNFYPWGLSLNVVQPLSTSRTRVRFFSFVWNDYKLSRGAGADVDTTEMEDEEIVESVQAGIHSRFYNSGRYSVQYETGTHHFHRLISQFMNKSSA